MSLDLGRGLHILNARLDRAADRIVQAELGVSYRRLLALTLVGEFGMATQRELADALGVTEQSTSRMTGVLAEAGWLLVRTEPGDGHRRRLSLTREGQRLVSAGQRLLEDRLAELVRSSGVPYDEYARHTEHLLAALDDHESRAGDQRLRADDQERKAK